MNSFPRLAVWIKPAGRARERLRAAALRARVELGGPTFDEHLTLLSGIEQPQEQAQRALVQLAGSVRPFAVRLGRCAHGRERMRSLYLRVLHSPELDDARRAAEKCFATGGDSFDPHISLVYGSSDDAAKQRLCAQLEAGLADLSFTVESLHLVSASSAVPVQEWRELAEKTLRPESSAE
ncbi:MAG TPA: 2'-5' RNA ligase family protein [Nevskiaceae bacterium]|nr:2'-5' RNA ligase family protein [Nevskiaceae bacterium]